MHREHNDLLHILLPTTLSKLVFEIFWGGVYFCLPIPLQAHVPTRAQLLRLRIDYWKTFDVCQRNLYWPTCSLTEKCNLTKREGSLAQVHEGEHEGYINIHNLGMPKGRVSYHLR